MSTISAMSIIMCTPYQNPSVLKFCVLILKTERLPVMTQNLAGS